MTVHSTLLGHAIAIGTSESILYTVPSGKRTIVKSIVATNYTAAAVTLFVKGKQSGSDIWLLEIPLGADTADNRSFTDPVWIVMNAGQQLVALAGTADVSIVVSGSELIL